MKKNVFIGMLFCLLLSGYSLKVNAQTADSSARHTLWKSFESAEQWQQTKDTQNNPVEYRGELIPAGIYAYQFEIEYESINASDIRIEFCVQSEGLEKNGLTKIAECNTKDLKGIMTVQVSPWNSFHSFYPVIRTDSSTKITRIDIYKQKCDHLAIITGVIQQRSVIYDPNMFDYPDGGFTLHLKMGGILDGISCKQECVLI